MAKKDSPRSEEPTRKQVFLSKRERSAQRNVLIFVGIVVLAVLLVLGYGLLRSQRFIVVNGERITVQDFRKFVRLNYYLTMQANAYGQTQQYDPELLGTSIGQDTIDVMIDQALLRQVAADMGIIVSEAEVEDEIRQSLGFPPLGEAPVSVELFPTPLPITPTATSTFVYTLTPSPTIEGTPDAQATSSPTVTPTPTADEEDSQTDIDPTPTATQAPSVEEEMEELFRQAYEASIAEWGQASGMSEAEIRELFATQALINKVFEAVELEVATTEEQALVAHIQVETAEEAERLLARAQEGEEFAQLAADNSLDDLTAYRGGELGWLTMDMLVSVPEIADLAFSLPIGEPGGPAQTALGYHVVLVYDRQTVDASQYVLDQRRSEAFQLYVDDLRAEANIHTPEDWQRYLPRFE